MKILITGGLGYIGSHTAVELLNNGYEIAVVDNLCNAKLSVKKNIEKITGKQFNFYKADIRDYKKLCGIFDSEKIDSVVHFAGLKAVGESVKNPLLYFDNNIGGTISLLRTMKEYGVKNIVFSSSATVYGAPDKVPVNEKSPLFAVNPYGRTKLVIEQMLTDLYASDNTMNIALLRYFNPIGAHKSGLIGEDPNGIPNNLVPFVAKVAAGKLKEISVFGNDYPTKDGTGVRDYIHIVDLARGHLLALKKLNKDGGLFAVNLGTGKGYSVLEVIHAFEKACGKKLAYKIVPRRVGDAAEVYADTKLAETMLKFKAELDIDDMCRDAWNYTKANDKL